jgi:hypothetical protein
MNSKRNFKLSIGSADEYKDYIAEIHFPGKAGIIISQEKNPGEFEISLHSFSDSAGDNYDYCRNVSSEKILLPDLKEAIEKAVAELQRLKKTQ